VPTTYGPLSDATMVCRQREAERERGADVSAREAELNPKLYIPRSHDLARGRYHPLSLAGRERQRQ
jgi:hypothetical protein